MRYALAALALLLAACGGGGGGGGASAPPSGGSPPPPPPTAAQAARLLTQATFGVTEAGITEVQAQGLDGWISAQIALPRPAVSHLAFIDAAQAANGSVNANNFYSLLDPVVDTRGAASYYDMLQRNAFGNFRTLLEEVTLHPMMGRYLTYLGNQKEDTAGTRTPDENYAREVMQLMTIGLVELNADGSPRLNGAETIPSYPMIFYPAFHSTSAKTFLGVTIPASATPDIAGDLRIALDRLFNHPNTGPFISRRLIQMLVTSNPSPAYVGRVAAVFANNGSGVRGDMAAVARAILMDAEARDMTVSSSQTFGKLREPVIRVTNWARSFGATSQTGNFLITSTSANTSLNQSPLASPSVFNFWRPGFSPPATTRLGQNNLLAPEFQVVDEVTTASYVNLIQSVVDAGAGSTPTGGTGRDVRASYSAEIALADNPTALVERMNLLLFSGQMSQTLQTRLTAAITAVAIPAATGSNQAAIDTARLNRAKTAVFFSMVSPEYLVQR